MPLAQPRTDLVPAHVLVVDDDDAIRQMLAEWFRGIGHRVSTAGEGEAAWDVMCTTSVDLLITDYDMPGLNGLELLRRVRAGPLRLPVIMISGKMSRNDPDLLPLLPPGVMVEKPFALATLQAAATRLLTPRFRPPGERPASRTEFARGSGSALEPLR